MTRSCLAILLALAFVASASGTAHAAALENAHNCFGATLSQMVPGAAKGAAAREEAHAAPGQAARNGANCGDIGVE